jgi:LysM repeat protein/ABC-type branched-subunit amino acid transport system substrate-binding protein
MMKILKFIYPIFLVICFSLSISNSYAQNKTPETRYVSGKKYLVHIVEKGHTLYAISKKYAVDIDYIVADNPGIENNLGIGQEVLISAMRVKRTEAKNSPEIKDGYLIYTVLKKENAYSISRAHNVPLNALYSANPGIDKGLRTGQQVRIPVQAVRDERMQNLIPATDHYSPDSLFGTYYNKDDSLINHIVKAKETMYGICRFYQVHPDSILKVNFGLPLGLLFKDTIRIPKRNPQFQSTFTATIKDNNENPITSDSYNGLFKFNNFKVQAGLKDVYAVALMLPLEIDKYVVADKDGRYASIENNIALQFYQGAMLAIDSLKNSGLSIDLYVYDTQRSPEYVKQHLRKSEFKNIDFIIGPMYRSVFDVVKQYAIANQIKMVCPVPQENNILFNAPFIFKATASTNTQMRYLAKYILTQKKQVNVIAIDSKLSVDKGERVSFIKTYNTSARSNGKDSIAFLSMEEYTIEAIANSLELERENVLVVPSSDVSFVTNFINRLTTIPNIKDYNITIYGLENWLKFDKIDPSYKNRFNIHLTSSYYLDMNNANTLSYFRKYRRQYKTDPQKFAIQGFDICYYFLSGLYRYGTQFENYATEFRGKGIQSEFKMFRSLQTNGFENINVYLLKYENYELKKIN